MGKKRLRPTPNSVRQKKYKTPAFVQDRDKDASNSVDETSELPHEIVDSILSLLPLKEAAATSILSRRWRYAWTFTTNLNFDVGQTLCDFCAPAREVQEEECHRYVHWINGVVEQHRGANIEQFRVCYNLDRHFTSSIDKWIQAAMEKSVQVLVLNFLQGNLDFDSSFNYTFPGRLLYLKEPTTTLSSNTPSLRRFAFLRVLDLTAIRVTAEVVDYFLYKCPVLEQLSVDDACDLFVLRVVGPSVSIKYLSIQNCRDIKSIEICDANLVSFTFLGHRINLLLKNVPLLVDVSITEMDYWGIYSSVDFLSLAFTQLSGCLSQLEALMLDLNSDTSKAYAQVFSVPTLAKIKELVLVTKTDDELAIHQLASFIKACPRMHKLVLELNNVEARFGEDEEKFLKLDLECCPHYNLKVVEVIGYRGRAEVVEHVRYLIENAVELEELVVDPGRNWRLLRNKAIRRFEAWDEEKARDHALRQLKQMVPSTIQFVCL